MSDDKSKPNGAKHDGPDHSSPYPVSRLAPAFDLVKAAEEIQRADQMITSVATGKLKVIVDQIRALQSQAVDLMESTRRDQALHHATCQFKKRPGQTYHLYQKPDGSNYVSMLSPADWAGNPPHSFLGSYRLEADMSWTPEDDIPDQDAEQEVLRRLMQSERLLKGDSGS